jgi:predicted RNA binding protein YcfA (HicA-like mRNA interferase family)
VAVATGERQPSYLRQGWQHRAAVDPIHGNKALKTGLLRHLLKMAEINESEL